MQHVVEDVIHYNRPPSLSRNGVHKGFISAHNRRESVPDPEEPEVGVDLGFQGHREWFVVSVPGEQYQPPLEKDFICFQFLVLLVKLADLLQVFQYFAEQR